MAEFDATDQNKSTLMNKMEDTLKETLAAHHIDTFNLIEYLHFQGAITLEDFYNLRLSDMERFVTPIQYSKMKRLFEDHGIAFTTIKCLKEAKSCPDLMDVDEEGSTHESTNRDTIFNYKIVKNSEGMIGNALIIVNKTFTSGKNREGADEDLKNFETMFKNMNVKTESYVDLDGNTMRERLEEFAEREANVSIVFVAISTHGVANNTVLSSDDQHIVIDDYNNSFRDNRSLIGKPKIFFIQACRGGLADQRIEIPYHESDDSKECSPKPESESTDKQTFATNMSDILIAYATSDRYTAWRDEKRGSWFITELRNSFEKYPKRNLLEILTITSNVIIHKYKTEKNDQIATQCCNFHSSLTKFVFL